MTLPTGFRAASAARLARDPGYIAIRTTPGIGAVVAAVFVAEIGDVTRFDRPNRLTSWAGLTPRRASPTGSAPSDAKRAIGATKPASASNARRSALCSGRC